MGQQVWDFGSIHGAIGVLRGHANVIQGQNEALEGDLAHGASVWTGEASDMWSLEQRTLNQHGQDFKLAVDSYLSAVEEATHNTAHQEQINASSFGG